MKKILLIDDETNLVILMKSVLIKAGYEVTTASNGLEGLEKLKNLKPDLIVLDVNMPKLGGIEFYEKICHGSKSLYPVLVLTARANAEKLFKELNVDGFLSKPFNGAHLVKVVENILNAKISPPPKKEETKRARIFIIENDEKTASDIAMALLKTGYTVDWDFNGISAVERILLHPPDAVVVKLDLPDISGDIVISKLKKMPQSNHVKYVLYSHEKIEELNVVDNFRQKVGVDRFIDALESSFLVSALENLLK